MAPLDLVVAAPLVARVLFGASPIGRVVQAATLGVYLASALRDWHDRRGIRKIDFRHEFGADLQPPACRCRARCGRPRRARSPSG